MKHIDIYTDGACSGNPGVGGWAAVLVFEGNQKQISGNNAHTTNNRMELQAVIEGLKALKEPCEVNVYSDAQYVVSAYNSNWIGKWKAESGLESRTNGELWVELDDLVNSHNVTFVKVVGHSGNRYNELCDRVAKAEIVKFHNK